MRTLGRILIILAAFALVMGLTYVIVNAGGSSTNSTGPAFERGNGGGFHPEGGHRDRRGGGLMFGMIRNGVLLAIIVAVIVIPKNIWQKRMRNVSIDG